MYLDIIPPAIQNDSSEEDVKLLAVHEDGSVEVLSGDLQSRRLEMPAATITQGQGALIVKATSLVPFDVAQKTFLKDRGDICAELSKSSPNGQADRSILVMITAPQGLPEDHFKELQVRMFAIPHVDATAPSSLSQGHIFELVTFNLPDTETAQMTSNFRVEFHAEAGTVLIRSGSSLITYGSLAFSPCIVSRFDYLQAESSSFQYFKPYLLAEASKTGLTIFDTKYQTVQAKINARRILHKVQKRNVAIAETLSVQILSYYPRLSSILALIGQSLVLFELVRSSSRSRGAKNQGISLLDAIDQGLHQPSAFTKKSGKHTIKGFGQAYGNNGIETNASWNSECLRMDGFVRDRDVVAFEESMASHLCGSEASEVDIQEIQGLKLPSNEASVDRAKIDYALSKIFETESLDAASDAETSDSQIEFLPPRLLQWLIDSNFLTSVYVERAIHGPGKQLLPNPCVAPALVQCDTSLQWLRVYLHDSPTIDLPDLMFIVNFFATDAMGALQTSAESSKMLVNGQNATNPQLTLEMMDVGHGDNRPSILLKEQAQSDAYVSEEARVETLRLALGRLQRYPEASITSIMQSMLTQEQILALVQFLRHELFIAGHTSHYRQQTDDIVTNEDPTELRIIVQTTACCIDALGPNAFVASLADDSFFARLIADLRDEISAALAGVEEATYLQGLLREVLRFGASAVKHDVQRYSVSSESSNTSKTKIQKPGTIVTMYSEPTDDQGDSNARPSMLPLSLQADQLVENMKRKSGGQMTRRSAREKAYLHRQREVGKYSFDRLVL